MPLFAHPSNPPARERMTNKTTVRLAREGLYHTLDIDGTTQATYDGHPLYTYIGDHSPGQDGGNNINLNGGVWHVVVVGSG